MNKNFIILLALAAVVYTANIWGTSVYILDEAKNAGCAMEMYQHDEWIVPTFNETLRTDKPPLHYYFMKIGYTLFGVNPFGARIFSSIMGILTVLTAYLFGRKIMNEEAAFYAGIILISSLPLAIQFHLAVPDPYLIFFLTLGWMAFIYAYVEKQSKFYYLFYAAIALAALAKGPVAVVFSGLIVLIFLIAQRKFTLKALRQIRLIQGALLFLFIVLPWYVAVGYETQGVWLEQFFFKHNVGRYTASMEGHGGFPLASVVIILAALMPFSFFYPQAVRQIWKKRRKDAFLQFCMIAVGVIAVFFAFSRTILPSYPEPAAPFFALLLGYFFESVQRRAKVKRMKLRINATVYFIVALALPLAAWIALTEEKQLQDLASLSVYFIILPLGAGTALVYIWKKDLDTAIYVYALSSICLLLIFFYAAYPEIDARNPVEQSATHFHMNPAKALVAYRDFNPAYVFAFRQRIIPLDSAAAVEAFEHTTGVYVITQKKHLPDLDMSKFDILFEGKDLFERPVTVVLEKKKK